MEELPNNNEQLTPEEQAEQFVKLGSEEGIDTLESSSAAPQEKTGWDDLKKVEYGGQTESSKSLEYYQEAREEVESAIRNTVSELKGHFGKSPREVYNSFGEQFRERCDFLRFYEDSMAILGRDTPQEAKASDGILRVCYETLEKSYTDRDDGEEVKTLHEYCREATSEVAYSGAFKAKRRIAEKYGRENVVDMADGDPLDTRVADYMLEAESILGADSQEYHDVLAALETTSPFTVALRLKQKEVSDTFGLKKGPLGGTQDTIGACLDLSDDINQRGEERAKLMYELASSVRPRYAGESTVQENVGPNDDGPNIPPSGSETNAASKAEGDIDLTGFKQW